MPWKGGPSSVLNMAGELCEDSFKDDAHRNAAIQTLDSRQTLSRAHEENIARVKACEVSVMLTPPVAYEGIAIACKRNSCKQIHIYIYLYDVLHILEKSTTWMTFANLSKMTLVRTRRMVNLSKHSISIAAILFLSFLNGSVSNLTTRRNGRVAGLVCLLSHILNLRHIV